MTAEGYYHIGISVYRLDRLSTKISRKNLLIPGSSLALGLKIENAVKQCLWQLDICKTSNIFSEEIAWFLLD